MTFGAPGYLGAAAALAAGVVALHLLVVRVPPSRVLPTARFVPMGRTETRRVARWPESLAVLAARVALLLFAGAAFARPSWDGGRVPVRRVVVVDWSGDVRSVGEVRDSARVWVRPGDGLVVFDSAARTGSAAGIDSLPLATTAAPGSISAALVSALRAAADLRSRAESVAIVVVSPVTAGEVDAATEPVRRMWLGGIRVVRVAGRVVPPVVGRGIDLRGAGDDPLRAILSATRASATDSAATRVVRGAAPGAADSAWARDGGRALVWWPAASGAVRDTIGGLVAGGAVAVAVFPRSATVLRGGGATVVGRWADGGVAAVEAPLGAGCVRTAVVPVPDDRADVRRVFAALAGPCAADARASARPAADSVVRMIAGVGSAAVPAAAIVAAESDRPSPIVACCVGLALVAAVVEWWLRRRPMVRTGAGSAS